MVCGNREIRRKWCVALRVDKAARTKVTAGAMALHTGGSCELRVARLGRRDGADVIAWLATALFLWSFSTLRAKSAQGRPRSVLLSLYRRYVLPLKLLYCVCVCVCVLARSQQQSVLPTQMRHTTNISETYREEKRKREPESQRARETRQINNLPNCNGHSDRICISIKHYFILAFQSRAIFISCIYLYLYSVLPLSFYHPPPPNPNSPRPPPPLPRTCPFDTTS